MQQGREIIAERLDVRCQGASSEASEADPGARSLAIAPGQESAGKMAAKAPVEAEIWAL